MSYILDALRKAERERGLTQVPNVMTVHDFRSAPRYRIWFVTGVLALCAAAMLWYFLPELKTVARHSASAAQNGAAQQAPAAVVENSPAPAAVPFGASRNEPSAPLETRAGKNTIPSNVPAEKRVSTVPPTSTPSSSPPLPLGEVSPPPNRYASSVPGGGLGPYVPLNGVRLRQDFTPSLQAQAVPQGTAAPPAAPAKPASLAEAIAMMNLSVLLYSDTPADRIVFINGRKYVEGDHIDGKYLIESITLEGAVLSYQGERAVLRPRQK